MLASDVNNTEFAGAVANPDALLNTEFYWREVDVLDEEKTVYYEAQLPNGRKSRQVDGMVVTKKVKVPYVKFWRPGDMTTVMDQEVRADHKMRWPDRWMKWQMQEGLIDNGQNIPGWKVEEWDGVNNDQRRELKYRGFHTVEQIAGATDSQVQSMGMGGVGLRENAKRAVIAKSRNASVAAVEQERKDASAREAKLQAQIDELRELLLAKQPKAKEQKAA